MTQTYRTALVTGASSGIGRSLAMGLAAQGTHVVVAARRQPELEELAHTIQVSGGRVTVRPMDVACTDATARAIAALDAELGGLDLVVANAGVGAPVGAAEPWCWEAVAQPCHVNLCGAVATLTGALPAMVARGRGHLVGVSSLAAFGPLPRSAAYSAPKAGLSMFLDCLRLDLAGTGVHVTTIHPGFIRTPMTARAPHPMPQLVELEPAVAHILKRLAAHPATIDFPQPLATLSRLAGRLPRAVREPIGRWVGRLAIRR